MTAPPLKRHGPVGSVLAQFCQGFSDRQLALIGLENSLTAKYKENLAVYREQAAQRAAVR